jgi:hypothetical protein
VIVEQLIWPIKFAEDEPEHLQGTLELSEPLPFQSASLGSGFYRPGKINLPGRGELEMVLYHTEATAHFIYLHTSPVDPMLMQIVGLSEREISRLDQVTLPGQLCMGPDRSQIIGQAIEQITGAPPLREIISRYEQQNLAIFPIAREGLKYQVAEAIHANYGYYCDEIVLDAHHVFDQSVPVYNRKVEMTLFKDKDLDQEQKENIAVAFIADSIASGLVMKEVITRIKERFDHIRQVEVISPLATVRGLSRIANAGLVNGVKLRVHVFETLLNALPPDYYYSAHFNIPELHIRPDLEEVYRAWWGQDGEGRFIADTACAGYGWSEVFFSPRKQIEMINGQLEARHGLRIADVVRRNLEKGRGEGPGVRGQ